VREHDRDDAPHANPGEALRDAGQKLLGLLVARASEVAMDRVDGLADRLTNLADGGGGLGAAARGGKALAEGKSPVRAALSAGFGGIAEKIKGMSSGGGGGGKKPKVTNIVEETDIGLPLRVTYNLWTQFEDFPGFMKKVKSVEQAAEEKLNWKAQIFWSNRSWEATIIEQVPDSHIVWRSKGGKGHVNGAVSFTELGPNLTRVLLVLEYYPQGLFERTGNIWRAQGRRARLEFKHFRRNAMASAILRRDEIEGWRGEIRDSEVVRTHEEALEDEWEGQDQEHGSEDHEPEDSTPEDGADDELAEDWDGDAEEMDEDLDDDSHDEHSYDDHSHDNQSHDDHSHDNRSHDDHSPDDDSYDDDSYDDYSYDNDSYDNDSYDDSYDDSDDDRESNELDEDDRGEDTDRDVEPDDEERAEPPRRRRATPARRRG
jgi:uncharacterized membrane protein